MRTDTSDLVGVSDAGRNLGRYASEAANGRTLVIVRNNEPTAALVSITAMDRLSKLDELEEDLRLWSVALVRSLTDTGERYSLESVAEEFGLDLDALDDDED